MTAEAALISNITEFRPEPTKTPETHLWTPRRILTSIAVASAVVLSQPDCGPIPLPEPGTRIPAIELQDSSPVTVLP